MLSATGTYTLRETTTWDRHRLRPPVGITRIWAGIDGLAALGADGTLTVLGLNKSEAMSNRPGIDFRNAAKITFVCEG